MRMQLVQLDGHNYDDQNEGKDEDEDLEEDIVGSRDVELRAVASPVALHVVDLHTVAIGALRDQNDDDHDHNDV